MGPVAAMISCGSGAGVCGAGCGSVGGPGVLTYVGHGGDFIQETTYGYVGNGAGNFGVIGRRFNMCWLNLCWLLLVPLLMLLMLARGQQRAVLNYNRVRVVEPQGPLGVCRIWGDPHVLTFDNHRTDFYSQGEYWIVKSDTVWIQARYFPTPITHGLSVTKEIIISGPFINNAKLRIGARTATWNGQPILTSSGSLLMTRRQESALHSMVKASSCSRAVRASHYVSYMSKCQTECHCRLTDGLKLMKVTTSTSRLLCPVNRIKTDIVEISTGIRRMTEECSSDRVWVPQVLTHQCFFSTRKLQWSRQIGRISTIVLRTGQIRLKPLARQREHRR